MKAYARDLIFISQINRDGIGTTPVEENYIKAMLENDLMKDDEFTIHCLSLSKKTYIAMGFNSFVVRLTDKFKKENNINI
jgi:hypothetical protein